MYETFSEGDIQRRHCGSVLRSVHLNVTTASLNSSKPSFRQQQAREVKNAYRDNGKASVTARLPHCSLEMTLLIV